MTLVVDASVACKWLVAENDSAQAEKVLDVGDDLVAPDLIVAEVCSVLWQRHRRGEINEDHAYAAQSSLADFFDHFIAIPAFSRRALEIAISLDHPIYDCFYLAVAEFHKCSLVSADKRLLASVTKSEFSGLAIGLGDLDSRR